MKSPRPTICLPALPADHSTHGPEEEYAVEDYGPPYAPEVDTEKVVVDQLNQDEQDHQAKPHEVDQASIGAESGGKQVGQRNHDKERGNADLASQLKLTNHPPRKQGDDQQHVHVCRDCPSQVGSSS